MAKTDDGEDLPNCHKCGIVSDIVFMTTLLLTYVMMLFSLHSLSH